MKIPSRSHGRLSAEERTMLRGLYGQDVYTVHTAWIDASFDHFECGPLSFRLRTREGYLVLDAVWEEDGLGYDFGWMRVGAADRAKGVRYSADGFPEDPPTISLTPSSPLSRITVYKKSPWPGWEFDHALLFEHEERFRYVISHEPFSIQRLFVTFDPAGIEEVLAGLAGEPV